MSDDELEQAYQKWEATSGKKRRRRSSKSTSRSKSPAKAPAKDAAEPGLASNLPALVMLLLLLAVGYVVMKSDDGLAALPRVAKELGQQVLGAVGAGAKGGKDEA